jgi:hypothetical protein
VFKFTCVIAFPIGCWILLRRNLYFLEDGDFIVKYETIYQNLYPCKSSVYWFMPIFCLKRLLIAMATAYIIRPIEIAIFCYIYLSLFSLGYNLNNKPMNTRVIQMIDNTNEFFILLSGYAIIVFSNWIYDPSMIKEGE